MQTAYDLRVLERSGQTKKAVRELEPRRASSVRPTRRALRPLLQVETTRDARFGARETVPRCSSSGRRPTMSSGPLGSAASGSMEGSYSRGLNCHKRCAFSSNDRTEIGTVSGGPRSGNALSNTAAISKGGATCRPD